MVLAVIALAGFSLRIWGQESGTEENEREMDLITIPVSEEVAEGEGPGGATDGESAPEGERASAENRPLEMNLVEAFQAGGWAMWPLLVCSIIWVGLSIYNAMMIRGRQMLAPEVQDRLEDGIRRRDYDLLTKTAAENPALLTNILGAGFERISGELLEIEAVKAGMEEAATEEVAKAMLPVNGLSIIAVISPMIGLLGTVSGMIGAFRTIALGGMGRPELFAGDINEALLTTASGLAVGIPAMISYYFFKYRFQQILARANRIAGRLVHQMERTRRADEESHESRGGDGESTFY